MIEVGDFVRTKKGKIFQYSKGRAYLGKDNEIIKHSKNIIDLIEVGDFINGMKIDDIGEIKRFGKTAQKCLWVNIGDGIDIIDEEIKDILTKEQHMQNCYKIAEENSSIN